jgi:hypothetical protein
MRTHGTITHDRSEETLEAKARWFQSLPLSERMEMLCSFTDLALTVNPALQERKHAQPVAGRVQVLSQEDLIRSKRAAGRDIDLEDIRLLTAAEPTDEEQPGSPNEAPPKSP